MALAPVRDTVTPGEIRQICLRDVFAYVYRRVPHLQDAEDITAEVFTAAIIRIPPQVREPRAWLIGMARRKIVDFLRKSGRRPVSLASDFEIATAGPDIEVQRREDIKKVREIVDGLPEEQREALLLKCAEGLSLEEIAVVMEKTVPSVKGLLQRARQAIYEQGSSYFLEAQEVM
jgi:RNA polymerase sigma-70 factor (ECF subfamily)